MPLGNGDLTPRIESGDDYIASLRGRNLKVFLFGELVDEPVDHPMIRPSINAVAETYDLALREPETATVLSPLTGKRVHRFLHVAQSASDLVAQNMMQRKLGQNTGTCFQRCVGMDAFNALHSVTYEIDEKHGTTYHQRLVAFLTAMQDHNYVVGGAMTDVKGDRSKAPHEQADPDLFVHVTKKNEQGVWLKGAKAHQTGCINSHWIIAMPTMRLGPKDEDYANHLHLWAAVVRHPKHGRRIHRCGERRILGPRSDGRARRRVRPMEPRVHAW
jgi:4-hydroxybutyryl-CoA dehydratase/vinylacetyl-CoA-Delta-isomerase